MDLVGYDEQTFSAIERDFRQVLEQIAADTGNPVEATFRSGQRAEGRQRGPQLRTTMPWYDGPSLLELLESLPPLATSRTRGRSGFPVQRVIRPDHTFRGFAGQIASGTIRPGDAITVLPSGRTANVERIVTWDGDLDEAFAPLSVTLMLDRRARHQPRRPDRRRRSSRPRRQVRYAPRWCGWISARWSSTGATC